MTISVSGRTAGATPAADGYVTIDRRWRDSDVVRVALPMRVRPESLPGTTDIVAFVYGPIVLAGRLGTQGVTSEAQNIVNERTSGDMLNAGVPVPVLRGEPAALAARVLPVSGEPLAFETEAVGTATPVRLAPWHRVAHERYVLYWRL